MAMRIWIVFLALVPGIYASTVGFDVALADTTAVDEQWSREVRIAQQADDLDCEDLETLEEAQAILDEDDADPHNLDPNRDGIACALLPSSADQEAAAADDAAVAGDAAAAQEADTGNQTAEDRRAARRAAHQAKSKRKTARRLKKRLTRSRAPISRPRRTRRPPSTRTPRG